MTFKHSCCELRNCLARTVRPVPNCLRLICFCGRLHGGLTPRKVAVFLAVRSFLQCEVKRLALSGHVGRVDRCPLSEGEFNRSVQHLLILLDEEVADGDVTDIVHGEAEGRTLGALEERTKCVSHLPGAGKEDQDRRPADRASQWRDPSGAPTPTSDVVQTLRTPQHCPAEYP